MPRRAARLLAVIAAVALALVTTPIARAATGASVDSFYTYSGHRPLSAFAPGEVLKTRTIPYHLAGLATPLQAVQLLYRTTDARGRASANVTSVVRSPSADGTKAMSYQSFYDSLNPEDGPSRAIAGGLSLSGFIANVEIIEVGPALLNGYTVVISDTEGQNADFAAGPEYGMNTLDSIRAATRSPATGLNAATRFGLYGYSGGAIATNWAAALAPGYAPDVNRRLVGFTEGGVLVDPAHNLKYIDGSLLWAGVMPMALIGVGRSYGLDLEPYLSDYGREVWATLKNASITNALGQYPGLTWKKLVKPQYADPNSAAPYIEGVNKVNMGQAPTPTVPGLILQGNGGTLEGTNGNPPGIGTGDGAMVAGDVRALARQYCETNDAITYTQVETASHTGTALPWNQAALPWLYDRFAGKPAPSNCGQIAPGNSLAPEQSLS